MLLQRCHGQGTALQEVAVCCVRIQLQCSNDHNGSNSSSNGSSGSSGSVCMNQAELALQDVMTAAMQLQHGSCKVAAVVAAAAAAAQPQQEQPCEKSSSSSMKSEFGLRKMHSHEVWPGVTCHMQCSCAGAGMQNDSGVSNVIGGGSDGSDGGGGGGAAALVHNCHTL